MNKNIVGSTGILCAVLGGIWGWMYAGSFGMVALGAFGLLIGLIVEIAYSTARKV